MKTCSECGADFDPKERGVGTGMALTCSKWCGDARRARQQREYKARRRAAVKAEAAAHFESMSQTAPENVTCEHCGAAVGFRVFVWIGTQTRGLCLSCAALAKRNTERKEAKVAKAKIEAGDREVSPLAALDAMVRSRKPTGSAWWWR